MITVTNASIKKHLTLKNSMRCYTCRQNTDSGNIPEPIRKADAFVSLVIRVKTAHVRAIAHFEVT